MGWVLGPKDVLSDGQSVIIVVVVVILLIHSQLQSAVAYCGVLSIRTKGHTSTTTCCDAGDSAMVTVTVDLRMPRATTR